MLIHTTRSWIESTGLPLCRCDGEFQLVAVEDRVMAGEVDPRMLDAKTLRSLGWDDCVSPRRAPRRISQRQCDHEGCGVFIAKAAERCARGHVQKWARGTIALAGDAIPF
jgi:hypothetical protein